MYSIIAIHLDNGSFPIGSPGLTNSTLSIYHPNNTFCDIYTSNSETPELYWLSIGW